jgi:hypothetical protein
MIEYPKIPIKTSRIYSGVLLTTMALVGLPTKVWLLICFELVVANGHDFLKVFADGLTAGTIREWLHLERVHFSGPLIC